MSEDVFSRDFWLAQWDREQADDTCRVHKGFATSRYWDRAADTYNRDTNEIHHRRIEKSLDQFRGKGLLFEGMRVLDIGCGPGLLSLALARQGARVTGLDFSSAMLDRFRADTPEDLEDRVTLVHADWEKTDISALGWEKKFDLVIAFMSPGVARPDALLKLMACARKGCAIRGWAAKRAHPILSGLWEKIMDAPLEDRPRSILLKINLLFSMGIYPDITFDTIEWDQTVTIEQELENQMAFFNKVSRKSEPELAALIRPFLEKQARDGKIIRKHQGLTATAVWRQGLDPSMP